MGLPPNKLLAEVSGPRCLGALWWKALLAAEMGRAGTPEYLENVGTTRQL